MASPEERRAPPFDLGGRVALVTGAARGVGAGIARALARQGATVVVNDLDSDAAAAVASGLVATGASARPSAFDVSHPNAVDRAIESIINEIGPLDILVNNAGKGGQHGIGSSQFRDSGPAVWRGPLAVDLGGVLNCCRAVVGPMCDRGYGRVITIVSDAGTVGMDIGVSAYAAAKGGAIALMRHIAVETASSGVTANSLALGLMEAPGIDPEVRRTRSGAAGIIPVGRLGTPDDVGAACVYLASSEASWMTGQTLHLNGGTVTT